MPALTEKPLRVSVITPAKTLLETEAKAVVVPAFDGEMGVLPGHAPILALLGTGALRVTDQAGETQYLAVRGRFMQVNANQVTVLTPEAVLPGDAQLPALQAEVQKLEAEKPTEAAERETLDAQRSWLRAQLKIQGRLSASAVTAAPSLRSTPPAPRSAPRSA